MRRIGGSNGPRVRLWKLALQRLAGELAIPIRVIHFPSGTSNWNKIAQRLFASIGLNWREQPSVSHELIVKLIAATTTRKGLKRRAQRDANPYPKGIKVSDDEFASIRLTRDDFHGKWNDTIAPNTT